MLGTYCITDIALAEIDSEREKAVVGTTARERLGE